MSEGESRSIRRAIGGTTRVLGAQPLIVAGVALFVVFALIQPNFASYSNVLNVATQSSAVLIAATGMTFVIITSGIDLSVGAVVFLGGAILSSQALHSLPPWLALLIVPLCCIVLGFLNGLAVAYVGIPAMIVTLATLRVFRGVGGHITRQESILVPDSLRFLGQGRFFGIPIPFVVAVVVVILGWLVLSKTVFGRHVVAIGSRRSAADNAGLRVRGTLVAVYALAGFLGGVTSLVQVGRLGAVQPTLGLGFELTVITAVVLGGTSLNGGRGSVVGTAVGAIILSIVENGLVLINASPYIFDIVRGVVLLAALLISGIPGRMLTQARNSRARSRAAVFPYRTIQHQSHEYEE